MGNRSTGTSSAPTSTSKPPARKGQFRQGVSGNPAGRPKKGESFTDIVRRLAHLKDVRDSRGNLVERKEAIVEMIYGKAIRDKDLSAAKMILDRLDPEGEAQDVGAVLVAFRTILIQATRTYPEARLKIIDALERMDVDAGP